MTAAKLRFSYRILNTEGACDAVSAAQAVNRAKVRYIYKRWGVKTTSPEFQREMAALKGVPVRIELDSEHVRRFVVLYRAAKDGDLTRDEQAEFKQLSSIFKDPHYK